MNTNFAGRLHSYLIASWEMHMVYLRKSEVNRQAWQEDRRGRSTLTNKRLIFLENGLPIGEWIISDSHISAIMTPNQEHGKGNENQAPQDKIETK